MECTKPEEAKADVLVEITVAVEGGFGVVEMQGAEISQAYDFVEIVEGLLESCGCSEIVAGCEDMAGIKAYADSALVFDLCDDVT